MTHTIPSDFWLGVATGINIGWFISAFLFNKPLFMKIMTLCCAIVTGAIYYIRSGATP